MTASPAPAGLQGEQAPPVRWAFDMGLPDVATFPGAALTELTGQALAGPEPPLLYGGPGRGEIARGHRGLREALAQRAAVRGSAPWPLDGILLTSGAAQGIDLLWRATLRSGDRFAVEAPTWGAAIRMGRQLGAEPVAIPMDTAGLRIDVLEQELARIEAGGGRLRLVYTIATYHTPTGWSLSAGRRRRLLELAAEHDFLVVDDRVYAELRYDGAILPPLASLPGGDRVVTVGSFSKTLAPALRLGWLMAQPDVAGKLAGLREDLGSSQLTASVLERFLQGRGYDQHLANITRIYRGKRDTAAAELRAGCGDAVRFDPPDGGMYFWIELAEGIRGDQVMTFARQDGVAVRPGEAFFGDGGQHRQWFRMAFTMVGDDELVRGVRVLAQAVNRSRWPQDQA
jgi:2-aminoadipate transaminase